MLAPLSAGLNFSFAATEFACRSSAENVGIRVAEFVLVYGAIRLVALRRVTINPGHRISLSPAPWPIWLDNISFFGILALGPILLSQFWSNPDGLPSFNAAASGLHYSWQWLQF
jgi:hypothetical protein